MRCLALAQAFHRHDVDVTFVMSFPSKTVIKRLTSEGMNVIPTTFRRGSKADAESVIELCRTTGVAGLILDGYTFDASYQKYLRDAGLSFLYIDDLGYGSHYYADFIVNQNLHAHQDMYRNREPETVLLLGTRYTLLRSEFIRLNDKNGNTPAIATNVLVTLGGSDSDNVTLKVIRALNTIRNTPLSVKIVAGMSNPHIESLRNALDPTASTIDGFPSTGIHIMEILKNADDMPRLMIWADIAVSAGGSTCWELAYMGLPSLLIVLADNQIPIADSLQKKGFMRNLGWHSDLTDGDMARELSHLIGSQSERHRMSLRGRQLIDGNGADRVADAVIRSWIPEKIIYANTIYG
jgi:UDP-2,4-diacetamido-2,4,6-trideoxy-beta-L-altropyranose hydrolase